MSTVLWCYVRNSAFKTDDTDYTLAADLTGQANHLGVTIQADIIKQKLPENNGGYNGDSGFGKTARQASTRSSRPTTRSTSAATRSRTATWAAPASSTRAARPAGHRHGRGREDRGHQQARRRHGPDLRRKAFQRPMKEGVELLNAIQDVYLSPDVTIA